MKRIKQSFEVKFEYNVIFTRHLFGEGNPEFRNFLSDFGDRKYQKKILFVVDEGVFKSHQYLAESIRNYFAESKDIHLVPELLVIPGGEQVKNNQVYFDQVMNAINEFGIDRHSFVAAIGGGAVLDMVGYVAAVAHRGVKHIRIPTTVLSQNDSGVGVKNSINFYGKKNFLGTFAPPVAVFNDSEFLTTLEERDWISGISEAVKVALIKDLPFFEWLEANAELLAARDMEAMNTQIFRCAELHMQHISSGDPFESGSARPLDFGHWAAHKLEYLTDFKIRHGEAVAIGIALDSVYSHLKGMISESALERILALLKNLGFNLFHLALAEDNKINLWKGLNEFREHLGGELTITLLQDLGKGLEVHEIDFEFVKEAVDYLENKFEISYP